MSPFGVVPVAALVNHHGGCTIQSLTRYHSGSKPLEVVRERTFNIKEHERERIKDMVCRTSIKMLLQREGINEVS